MLTPPPPMTAVPGSPTSLAATVAVTAAVPVARAVRVALAGADVAVAADEKVVEWR